MLLKKKGCKPKKYQDGGRVRGPGTATSDSILARVANGEFILPPESVDIAGVDKLEALRQAGLAKRRQDQGIKGYANGGLVGVGMYPPRWGMSHKGITAEAVDNLLGVGTGAAGAARAMAHSDPANAAVLDVTQTREFQDAIAGARNGGGNTATPGLLGMTVGPFSGETPNQTLERLYQAQANTDDMVRRSTGGPTPTERRILMETNRYNPRAIPGYAEGGLVGNTYGSYITDDQRRQLNSQLGDTINSGLNSIDASLKSAGANASPTISTAYGAGATPPPEPKPYQPQQQIQQQQSQQPASTGAEPYSLQSMAQVPSGFQAPQGYQQVGNSGYFSQSQLMSPGTQAYQGAMRERLGGGQGSFAGGSEALYDRRYMGPAGSAVGYSSAAPGTGTLSVADQGNGGTVQGNVAAINSQIAALRDLNKARLDDPYTGRASFGAGTANPFSLPGDSYQDSRGRAAMFDQLMRDATSGTKREQRGATAGLQSLMNILQGNQQQALGLAQIDQRRQSSIAEAVAQQYQAAVQQQQQQQQAERQSLQDDRRYGLDVGRLGLDMSRLSSDPTQRRGQLANMIAQAQASGDMATREQLIKLYRDLGFSSQPDQLPLPGQG